MLSLTCCVSRQAFVTLNSCELWVNPQFWSVPLLACPTLIEWAVILFRQKWRKMSGVAHKKNEKGSWQKTFPLHCHLKRTCALRGSKHASTRWGPTKGITQAELALMRRALLNEQWLSAPWFLYQHLLQHSSDAGNAYRTKSKNQKFHRLCDHYMLSCRC